MNLLTPRFKVIGEYPNCNFKKGQILQRILNATNDWYHTDLYACMGGYDISDLKKHPHLFRKLEWYEERTVEEMPKYLKHRIDINSENWTYEKVTKWDLKRKLGFINNSDRECCDLGLWGAEQNYQPATEKEYLQSLKNSQLCKNQ